MGAPVELSEFELWFAEGAPVVELTYHGRGDYSAIATTVARVTRTQIITTNGNRFWRTKCGMKLVGQTDQLNGGMRIDPTRIVPPTNPHAVAALARVAPAVTATGVGRRSYRVHWTAPTGEHRRWRKDRDDAQRIAARLLAEGHPVRFFHVADDGTETDLPINLEGPQ